MGNTLACSGNTVFYSERAERSPRVSAVANVRRAAAGRLPTAGRGPQRATWGPIGGRASPTRGIGSVDGCDWFSLPAGVKVRALESNSPKSNRPNQTLYVPPARGSK